MGVGSRVHWPHDPRDYDFCDVNNTSVIGTRYQPRPAIFTMSAEKKKSRSKGSATVRNLML